jgi:protein tyrosine/serine phosphatase
MHANPSHRKSVTKKLALLLAFALGTVFLVQAKKAPAPRDTKWAQPISIAGVPNLYKISDELYRGAQPTAEGIKGLKKMGIRTIVSLRAGHSDKDLIGDTGPAYVEIPCRAWRAKDEEIVKFLRIATDKSRQPVFFHCAHGSDRTGEMCAAYRVVVQGWTKEDAINEMKHGGYGFHWIWINLDRHIKGLDVDAVKKATAAAP